MASSAGDAARGAADRIQRAPDALAEQTRGNPLAAGLIAFGAGMLVATAFPRTRAEERVVDSAAPAFETAKQELREGGRELATGAKEHAQEAAQHVSESASEAGREVADHAKASAGKVTDPASSSESSS
jgi:glutamate synthase domain-containing protein 1